jgi:AraC family transcriptional regulator of adaptative response / DNA-3-methyladenine glycosylase II
MTVEVLATDLGDLTAAVTVAERLTDATCDPAAVVELLGVDPALAEAVRAHPGRRMPACADGFEALVRAVLGQQVTLGQGVALAVGLVEAVGRPAPEWAPPGLTKLPLEPADVVDADLTLLGMPAKRRAALHAAATAVASGRVSLATHANRAEIRQALLDVPGIGPWTADYVALRGLADPDAFPAGDVALQRGARALGLDASPEALLRRAERWRPWRAIAAAHLWANAAVPSAPGPSHSDDATRSHVTTRST